MVLSWVSPYSRPARQALGRLQISLAHAEPIPGGKREQMVAEGGHASPAAPSVMAEGWQGLWAGAAGTAGFDLRFSSPTG